MMNEKDRQMVEKAQLPEILTRIRDNLPELAGEERSLAEYIMFNVESVPNLSLVQLAEAAQVSPSAVIHFCDDIGCEGFHALHTALEQIDSVAASVMFEHIDTYDLKHTVQSVFENISNTLDQTLASLDMENMQQAVDAVSKAEHVLILGLGTSGSVAQELAYRLEWIGVNCGQYVDPHRQLMAATLLEPGDLAIAVSHSGRTKSVVNSLKVARERGAKTMCITDFPHSPITRVADICICAVHAENSLGVEMVATRAAHLALVDCISMCVAQQNRDRAIRSIKLNERLLINLRY
jgi:RpiR family carbohydrate utilization transcriptional regulator